MKEVKEVFVEKAVVIRNSVQTITCTKAGKKK